LGSLAIFLQWIFFIYRDLLRIKCDKGLDAYNIQWLLLGNSQEVFGYVWLVFIGGRRFLCERSTFSFICTTLDAFWW
jgi:hypothetical protein